MSSESIVNRMQVRARDRTPLLVDRVTGSCVPFDSMCLQVLPRTVTGAGTSSSVTESTTLQLSNTDPSQTTTAAATGTGTPTSTDSLSPSPSTFKHLPNTDSDSEQNSQDSSSDRPTSASQNSATATGQVDTQLNSDPTATNDGTATDTNLGQTMMSTTNADTSGNTLAGIQTSSLGPSSELTTITATIGQHTGAPEHMQRSKSNDARAIGIAFGAAAQAMVILIAALILFLRKRRGRAKAVLSSSPPHASDTSISPFVQISEGRHGRTLESVFARIFNKSDQPQAEETVTPIADGRPSESAADTEPPAYSDVLRQPIRHSSQEPNDIQQSTPIMKGSQANLTNA
ncbi:hypothetical protein SCHPADRAFT_992652 [Schizopora paradoxa]|uniref:Uncharacterized protein n=1 Tax=Schizopora paradoxa TaxID=27342 RepID=A0A0H2S6V9_9AGAM|nr:hypothetical protein SCHPADRAFT_992652 [Schizopora paradoxa]